MTDPPLVERDDLYGMFSLALTISGLILRHRVTSWIALLTAVLSYVNYGSTEKDVRQSFAHLSFAILGLINYYVMLNAIKS